MVSQPRRWVPERAIVLVADSTYAVLALLHHCTYLASPVTVVTRLRLDARLFAPAPARRPGTTGRPRKVGARRPTLHAALACVRRHLWRSQGLAMSPPHSDRTKLLPIPHERLVEALCYAG